MRIRFICLLLPLFVAGCQSLQRLLPEKPVWTERERQQQEQPPAKPIPYQSQAPPALPFPVFPVQVWAATYDLDVILVSQNKDWNMHEFARIKTRTGDLWLMKDADNETLTQTIVADVPHIDTWLPEIPVQRKSYPVVSRYEDMGKYFKLHVEYENIQQQTVVADYWGKKPHTRSPKRNGSTMGHSRRDLIAVLDLPMKDLGKKANITYAGQPYKIKKLLGIVPFQMALTQTQAGLSRGDYRISAVATATDSLLVQYPRAANRWIQRDSANWRLIEQKDDFRHIVYYFQSKLSDTNTYFELSHATVRQWNSSVQDDFRISFFPSLPDLRYPLTDRYEVNFVMDVGGQRSHAVGKINVLPTITTTGKQTLEILPLAPWWVQDRPTQVEIEYKAGTAIVHPSPLEKP